MWFVFQQINFHDMNILADFTQLLPTLTEQPIQWECLIFGFLRALSKRFHCRLARYVINENAHGFDVIGFVTYLKRYNEKKKEIN